MKVHFKVINLGLNELGVEEYNKNMTYTSEGKPHYGHKNVGDFIVNYSKTFKVEKNFLNLREENSMGSFGSFYWVKLKHINYKIVRIEIIETQSEFEF
tara:strand:+ start:370 stop:663 length:294 start_codon:yes stop_codon:yes gene_type:complete